MINIQKDSRMAVVLITIVLVALAYTLYTTKKVVDAIYDNTIGANSADRVYDPFIIEGTEFIDIDSKEGQLPAQYLSGSGETWLLVAHGVGGGFRETESYIKAARDLGVPAVTYTYRNHAGAPITDGISTFGIREQEDVVAVMDYARGQGAKKFVLAGMSHGGALVLNIAYQDSLNSDVVGLLLQSPATNVARIIREKTVEEVPLIPGIASSLALAWTSHKNDIDWTSLDYTARINELKIPALVIQGTEDKSVPLQHSKDFAAANSTLVEIEIFEGSAHVKEAEDDPVRFNRIVTEFINALM